MRSFRRWLKSLTFGNSYPIRKDSLRVPIKFESLESRITPARQLNYWLPGAVNLAGPAPESDLYLTQFHTLSLDQGWFRDVLNSAKPGTSSTVIELLRPDKQFERFAVEEVPILAPELAAKFPDIKTYRGIGLDDPTANLALDISDYGGVHAQVLSSQGAYYLDPYQMGDTSLYMTYFKRDALSSQEHQCLLDGTHTFESGCCCPDCGRSTLDLDYTVDSIDSPITGEKDSTSQGSESQRSNGTTLRTFRTAVAVTGEYTAFYGGTVPQAMTGITTTINRVSQVYELEIASRLQLVANNNLIVYTSAATDPYTNQVTSAQLNANQTNIDNVIGTGNYDVGHLFTTDPGGGLAGLGVVGLAGQKARGGTGLSSPQGDPFDIDFVAHEFGHQFGANHTFNGATSSLITNRNASTAYEVGSGSTIMAYAGVGGSDNIQLNSDPQFHSASYDEILAYLDSIPSVGTSTATGNTPPTVSAGPNYTIPTGTPFTLTATGSDANGDTLTYSWEERDLGPAVLLTAADNGSSPIVRPRPPSTSPSRTIPQLSDLLSNTSRNEEKLPAVARTMKWRVTARDNRLNGGGVANSDMTVNVVNTGAAFQVTSPNTAVSWAGASLQTVAWNVAGTTGNGINVSNVRILLSTDGGNTFPTILAASTPNDGSETITVPDINTTQARIRVEPVGNIFFDISNVNFTISAGVMAVASTTPAPSSVVSAPLSTLRVAFTRPYSSATIGTDDLSLNFGSVTGFSFVDANTVDYTLSGVNRDRTLTVTMAAGAVTTSTGTPLEATTLNYEVDIVTAPFPEVFVSQGTLGTQVYRATSPGSIAMSSDTDSYTLNLNAGQTLTAILSPVNPALRPTVTITPPTGTPVTGNASAAGQAALVQSFMVSNSGTYTVTAASLGSTSGAYDLTLMLNSAEEAERQGGSDNASSAENLDTAFLTAGNGSRAAVSGSVQSQPALPGEVESNNTTATANDASFNFSTFSGDLYHLGLTGTISSGTDTDYFAIGAMQAGDILSISESGSPSSRGTLSDPFVELYRFNGGSPTLVASNDDNGPGFDSLIYRFSISIPDMYFVRATKFSTNTGTYSLGLYLENSGTAPSTGGTVTSETESNDSIGTANDASTSWRAVQYRSTTTGSITTGDTDVFKYTFTAGDLVSFVVNSTSSLDARINIRNAAGTIVASEDGTSQNLSSGSIADSFVYSYIVPSSGTYFLEVLSSGTTTGTYTAIVYLSTNTAPLAPQDFDRYAFTLTAGTRADLVLSTVSGSGLTFDLLDPTGAVVGTGSSATNATAVLSGYLPLTTGVYQARITTTASTADYTLLVTRGVVFDREANNSLATAQPLNGAGTAIGAVGGGDEDWYSLTVQNGNLMTLTASAFASGSGGFNNSLDPVLELYGPSGTFITSDDNSAGGVNAQISTVAGSTGLYRIRVRGGASAGEYTLRAALSPDASDDVFSMNEDQSVSVTTAQLLSNDTGTGLSISYVVAPRFGRAAINSSGGFTYQPFSHFNGTDSMTYRLSSSNGGSDLATIYFNIAAVNDAPVNNLPAAASSDGNPVSLNGFSISDVDAGTGNMQVTLSLNDANSTLAVSTSVSGGLTAAGVTGNNSPTVVLTGTLAAINATLAAASGLVFTPSLNVSTVILTMTTSDLGNSGSGGALTDVDTLRIGVGQPRVTDVLLGTSTRTVTVLNQSTAPFVGVARFQMRFSGDARALNQSDLTITGVLGGAISIQSSSFNYDSGTDSTLATWNFNAITRDRLTFVLIDNIGISGGTQTYVRTILPGDANGSGLVDLRDAMQILAGFVGSYTGYNPNDVNLDGVVDINDFIAARSRIGSVAP